MPTKAGHPYKDTRIAKLLTKRIDEMKGVKSQREIAQQVGYNMPNMISMLKRGEAKVPLDKVPALAKALDVDPVLLFRLALEQNMPELYSAINSIFGALVTKKEAEVLAYLRELTGAEEIELTPALRKQLSEVFAPEMERAR